jgi:O-antigen/teichoic acid export membrane protein
VLRNVVLTGVGLAVVGLMRLGFNAIALRGFGEAVAGQLNVALSLSILLSLPATTAFGGTTVRFIGQAFAQGRRERAARFYRVLILATLASAAVVAVGAILARDLIAPAQQLEGFLVIEAAVVAVGYALYLVFRYVLYAIDRVAAYARLELLGCVAFFAVTGALAWLGAGTHLILAFVAANLLFGGGTLWITRELFLLPCPAAERPSWGPVLSFSFIAAIGTAASLCVRELAVFAAPHVADLGGAAHLGLSMSLLAPLQMFPRMLRSVIFAHSAQLDGAGRRDEVGRSVTEATHWLLVAVVPACGLLGLAGGPLIELLGGTATPERLLVFRLLTVAALMEVMATPAANALPGVGHVKAPNYAAVVALAVTGVIWLAATPELGLVGLALGMVANAIVKGGVPMWFAWRDLGARPTRAPGRVSLLIALTIGALGLATIWPEWQLVLVGYVALAAPTIGAPLQDLVTMVRRRLAGRRAAAG